MGHRETSRQSELHRPAFPADSRDYILPFEIHSTKDCPGDFRLPPDVPRLEAGLFLPCDPPDWLGRSAYPPRLLLLLTDSFYSIPHESAKEPPAICKLEAITGVETGHMLLKGWLELRGAGFCHRAPYNRAGHGPVAQFLRRLRGALLQSARLGPSPRMGFSDSLDLKFANALKEELDADEPVIGQFFQAPRQVRRKTLWISRLRWTAGDLLVWTAKRLLWISDRDRASYSHYGWISRYVRRDAVRHIRVPLAGRPILEFEWEGGGCWQVPLHSESIHRAEEFVSCVSSCCTDV
jgi:hypothetical protein